MLRRINALLAPAVRADGRRLELEESIDGLGVTSATGNAARLAIAASLLAATDGSTHVACRVTTDDQEPVLRIECRDRATLTLDQEVAPAVADSGIRMQAVPSAISISFPR